MAMKMKQKLTALLFLLLLPLLGGCENEDNVIEIFTGKTWKLNIISLDGHADWFDFWNGDVQARQKSLNLRGQNNSATFTITFNGSETGEITGGDFTAQAVNCTYTGVWSADGSSHTLTLSNIRFSGNDTDVLARAFDTGLKNAIRYSGDSQNLYIYYEDGQTTKRMAFQPQ